MITPNNLNENDVIAYSSMSDGIVCGNKLDNLEKSKKILSSFKILEDNYVNKSLYGESSVAINRAKELEKLIINPDVKAIISVTGGNFLNEIFDYTDLKCFNDNIKWIQGQSDTTMLLYYLTTKYEIKTIYSFNANSLAKASNKEIDDNLNILKGKNVCQNDYKNGWIFKKNIDETGIIIGGCLECLMDFIGTKFDYTKSFIEKYKNEGIIWYFDIDYMPNEVLCRNLWHLKNLGWFKYTNLIIFGRGDDNSYINLSLNDAINKGLSGINIKYISNFDLGHSYPRITIVNGSKIKIICNEKERSIELLKDE